MSENEVILSDEELARKVQEGDVAAFGTIMERYAARLTRYGRRYLARDEDIEDVMQDVFLKTYQNIQSYNTAYRFSPWIYRIAHNAFVNVLRKHTHRTFEFFDFDTFVSPLSFSEPQEVESAKLERVIEEHLSELAPKYREVIVLHYFEELSYDEIAEVLHIPIGTVGVRLRRARLQLKETLRTSALTSDTRHRGVKT